MGISATVFLLGCHHPVKRSRHFIRSRTHGICYFPTQLVKNQIKTKRNCRGSSFSYLFIFQDGSLSNNSEIPFTVSVYVYTSLCKSLLYRNAYLKRLHLRIDQSPRFTHQDLFSSKLARVPWPLPSEPIQK